MKYRVTLNGKNYEVEVERDEAAILSISDASVAPAPAPAVQAAPAAPAPVSAPAPAPAPAPVAAPAAGGEVVSSPMPGTILSIKTSVGARVNRGDVLLILEAMKMENEIVAPREAVVAQIVVAAGANVDTGAPLVVLN